MYKMCGKFRLENNRKKRINSSKNALCKKSRQMGFSHLKLYFWHFFHFLLRIKLHRKFGSEKKKKNLELAIFKFSGSSHFIGNCCFFEVSYLPWILHLKLTFGFDNYSEEGLLQGGSLLIVMSGTVWWYFKGGLCRL